MHKKKTIRQRLADLRTHIQMSKTNPSTGEFTRRLISMLNHYVAIVLGFLIAYLVLLLLLIQVEKGAEGATIRNI